MTGDISRRGFVRTAARGAVVGSAAVATALAGRSTLAVDTRKFIIDTHMHVWGNDRKRYPFVHPYQPDFVDAPHSATLESLIADMDEHGCTHSVLVQVIYHGWDNQYLAACLQKYPSRLRGHGLIDPTDIQVADKLEFWMEQRGLHGMRFSPIYYENGQHGGDDWIEAPHMHRLWKVAAARRAIFNFFISPRQLPKLARMIRTYPEVPIVIDHLGRADLKSTDAEAELKNLLDLARMKNVWVKVSELNAVSREVAYPFRDTYGWVKRVYEAFGPDRLLFGTGFPGSARAAYNRPTLREEIDLIDRHIPCFTADDRLKILGGNAAKLWNFA